MSIISLQIPLRPVLSTVIGNVEYTRFSAELHRIDELLRLSGIEKEFLEKSIEQYRARGAANGVKVSANALLRYQERSITALRSMILMSILGEDFRGMSLRLAECQLFRIFCQLERLGPIKVPAKSTLQEYSQWLPETEMRDIIGKLLRAAAEGKKALELANDLELTQVWLDSTCIKANIHFPVDWVLLRDAVRTLMKATALIRKHGLKSRMDDPQEFLSAMNKLSIQMTQSRRKSDAKRQRKKTLRRMKKLVRVVTNHAQRHRDLLDKEWENTDWTRKQAEQVLQRIDGILKQLPQAQKQAHERIIGERQVKNCDKILSLYDRDIHVIVRGKADAEVEFGNTLLLAEQANGLITDWKLHQDSAPADSKLLQPSLARLKAAIGKDPTAAATDRGFDSQDNVIFLEKEKIFNAICPKSPHALGERLQETDFVSMQKRRASTEGRISIFKNTFLQGRLRVKSFAHRELAVAWHVLAHDLWVLARLPKVQQQQQLSQAA